MLEFWLRSIKDCFERKLQTASYFNSLIRCAWSVGSILIAELLVETLKLLLNNLNSILIYKREGMWNLVRLSLIRKDNVYIFKKTIKLLLKLFMYNKIRGSNESQFYLLQESLGIFT